MKKDNRKRNNIFLLETTVMLKIFIKNNLII